MSIYAIVWAYDQDIEHSGMKFTLVTAAQYANDEGICWVKQETLAKDMSMGLSTVRRHLNDLEENGVIERFERRRPDGTRSSDLIKLLGYSRRSNRAVDDQPPESSTSTAQIEQDNRSNRAGNKRQYETSNLNVTTTEESSTASVAYLDKTITECLKLLKGIENFPSNDQYAGQRLMEIIADYPKADAEEVVKSFAAYLKDEPLRKPQRGYYLLRNSFKHAHDKHVAQEKPRKVPKVVRWVD